MPDNYAIFVIFATLFSKFYICSCQNVKVCDNVLGQAFRPDFDDCSKYHLCSPQKDWILLCDPGMVWNQEKAICVVKGSVNDTCSLNSLMQYKQKVMAEKLELKHSSSTQQLSQPLTSPDVKSAMDRWSAKFFCAPGVTGKFAHPTKCAQYYDCSKTKSMEWWGQNFRECEYPKLYNELTKDCEPPSKVKCNARQRPIDPCDYIGNQCRSAHCVPCHIRYATCRGLPNGLHQWRGREMSSYFIVCKNERVIFHGRCQESKPGQLMVFSISLQTCVDKQKAVSVREENIQNLLRVHQANGRVTNLTMNPQFSLNVLLTNETEAGYYTNTSKELQQNQTESKLSKSPNQTLVNAQQNKTNAGYGEPLVLQPKPIQIEPEPVIPPHQQGVSPTQPVIPPYQQVILAQHGLQPQQPQIPQQHPAVLPLLTRPEAPPQRSDMPPQPVLPHNQSVRTTQKPLVLPQQHVISSHPSAMSPLHPVGQPNQHIRTPPQQPVVLRQPAITQQQRQLPHSFQQMTSESMNYPLTTKQTLRMPPSANLDFKGSGVGTLSSGTGELTRLPGVKFLSGNANSFGNGQSPLMVETTKFANLNMSNRTHSGLNKVRVQPTYTQPTTMSSNIVKIVQNSWVGFNHIIQNHAYTGTTEPVVETTTMSTNGGFSDLSKMGRRIDILPFPNVNKEPTFTSSQATNILNVRRPIQSRNHKPQMPNFAPVEPIQPRNNKPQMLNLAPVEPIQSQNYQPQMLNLAPVKPIQSQNHQPQMLNLAPVEPIQPRNNKPQMLNFAPVEPIQPRNHKPQMLNLAPVEPMVSRKQNQTIIPPRQARMPVINSDPRIHFMNNRPAALAVNPITNTSRTRNVRPIHPAMFSSFPEQSGISKKSAWSPVAFRKNPEKGIEQAVSEHTTEPNNINIKGMDFKLPRHNKTRLLNLLLDVLDQIKQNATILSLKKKLSFINNKTLPENTQKMIKEVDVAPTPVAVQNQKPTEVISMDVIPDKNVLSNKHIPNIERVVTKMQNHAAASTKTPTRLVFLKPFKFSSARSIRNNVLQKKKHTVDNNAISGSTAIKGTQDNTTPSSNQLMDSNAIIPHSKSNNRKTSLPHSLWRSKILNMARNNLKSTKNRNVNDHQYSELVERLNFLGTSGRGRMSENPRLLPLATLAGAKHRVFKQRKLKISPVATFSGRAV